LPWIKDSLLPYLFRWGCAHPRTVLFTAVFALYIPSWIFMPQDITVMGGGDAAEYVNLAHSMLDGKGFWSFYRAPLYPALLTVPIKLFGDDLFYFRMMNALFHAVTLVLLFSVTEKLSSRRTGWIFGACFLAYPHFAYQAANILTESLFMVLVAGTVSLLYRKELSFKTIVLAGLLSGLAMLTRPNFILFPPLAAGYLWYKGNFRWKGISRCVLYLAFTVMAVSPWTCFNYIRSGGTNILVTSGGGYNFWLGNSIFTMDQFFVNRGNNLGGYLGVDPPETRQMTEKERIHPGKFQNPFLNIGQQEKLFYYQSREVILSHPLLFAKLYAVKFLNALRPWSDSRSRYNENLLKILVTTAFYLPLFVLGLAGMYLLWRKRTPRIGVLILPIVATFCFLVLFWPSQRFRVPLMDPYLMIFCSFTIERLIDYFKNRYSSALSS
ncbi:MAG: glycosyltransferase family 39 protein, partial [Gemmatimonadota bacterium]|nr:glycosyltransferase family 39 protein [Gemmatimonadota bacterium]